MLGFGTSDSGDNPAFCRGPPRGVSRSGLQSWIDRLTFQGEDAENALVNPSEGLSLDEPFEPFDP